MKKIRLTFDAREVYCFPPEGYWWKQFLINQAWAVLFLLIYKLVCCSWYGTCFVAVLKFRRCR